MVLTPHQQRMILLGFVLVMIPIAAFILRNVCGLFRQELPSWKRAIVMVLVVGPAAYFTFDFTAYLILLALQDVYVNLPAGYGYAQWMHEPLAVKWQVINAVPLLRILPFLFTIAVAGSLQSILLQLQVPYRLAVVLLVVQWAVTLAVAYGLSWGLNRALLAAGPALAPAPGGVAGPAGPPGPPALPEAAGPGTAIAMREKVEDAAVSARGLLANARDKLTTHFDPVIDDLEEACGPVVKYLPEPVERFLRGGGWWAVLAAIGLVALLWLRSVARRIARAFKPSRKKGKKRPQTKMVPIDLRESLAQLGEEGYTEEGARQVTVKGVPARLRLIVLAAGNKDMGPLQASMADSVLDWIRPGLSEVAEADSPRVVLWPPHYSTPGFSRSFAANVKAPGGKGQRSAWVLVSGRTDMGRHRMHVGLVLHTTEPTTLRHMEVAGDGWMDAIGMTEPAAAARR